MKLLKKLVGCVLLLGGLLLFLSPSLRQAQSVVENRRVILRYREAQSQLADDSGQEEPELLAEMRRFNEELYQSGQSSLRDAWSCEENPLEISMEDDLFGYIEIPKMELSLPLYVGTTNENMSRGAAVMGQSSFPVGGANTNSVIAGHRGYQGVPFFREIEKLEPGDSVYVHGPWETLEYIVSETLVIEPSDIDAVRIQPDQDMVTLITCHPYMSHGRYRYLVYCHRKGTEPTPIPQTFREKEVVFESSDTLILGDSLVRYGGAAVILLLLVLLLRKK